MVNEVTRPYPEDALVLKDLQPVLVNRVSEPLLAISGERPLCGCRSSKQLSLPEGESSQSHKEKERERQIG